MGEFNERVLLLPTSARKGETVGDGPAETVEGSAETTKEVDLLSTSFPPSSRLCGEERQQLRLSRMKSKKPSAPNPLLAL
ncbi:unnamed protein product, partial [Ascophyllum nodosum]